MKNESQEILVKELKQLEERKKEIENALKNKENNDFKCFEPFYGKWIYFEGYESGSTLINMSEVRRNNKNELVFYGVCINLKTENSDYMGVVVEYDYPSDLNPLYHKGFKFDDMPYFENAYDFEDLCSDDENFNESIPYVVEWIIKQGEEMNRETVEKTIQHHLYWNINEAFEFCENIEETEDEDIPFYEFQ